MFAPLIVKEPAVGGMSRPPVARGTPASNPAPTEAALTSVRGVAASIVNCVPLIENVPVVSAVPKPAWSSAAPASIAAPTAVALLVAVCVAFWVTWKV